MCTGSLLTVKIFIVLFVAFGAYTTVSASCANATCASDEYCDSSSPDCQCNSTLYTNTGTNPTPTVDCSGGKLNILISKCWLEKNGYNTLSIRLQSPECLAAREIVNDKAQMTFHRPLVTNDCNNTVVVNKTHVTYSNILYIFAKTNPQIKNDVLMNVSCTLSLTMTAQLNVNVKQITGSAVIDVPGVNAKLEINMAAYRDPTFTSVLSQNDQLMVEDTVYISVIIPSLDVNTFKVKVVRIYASPAGAETPQYDLLLNGCPAKFQPSNLMNVISNGESSESRFSMKVFQISVFLSIMLYADVEICTTNCTTDCSSQTKSLDMEGNTVRVGVYLEASDMFDLDSANGYSMPWTLTTLMLSWMLVNLILPL